MNTETVRKTYKYKLKPTPEQERQLEITLWRCRTLYNVALEQRRIWWQRGQGKGATYHQQKAELPDLKVSCPEYAEVNAQVLQDVILRVERAFHTFFRRVKAGKTPGYPRFQGRSRYHSFTYPQYGHGTEVVGGVLNLSKIGRVAVRWSRPIEGDIKTVTISKEMDGWYVSFTCAEIPIQPLSPTGRETGIDVGLKVFLITSDGNAAENPRHHRKSERAIAKAQRTVDRRKNGSKRQKTARVQVATNHRKVQRQRRDFHHKTALDLLRNYDTIYLEDLRVANMVRNRHLSKSISDAGWAQFRAILECKAVYAGKRVVAVPPAYTSQDCSDCGTRIPKSLSVRTHVCTSCGLILDRDENAARNIQWAGRALRGLAGLPAGMNRESAGL